MDTQRTSARKGSWLLVAALSLSLLVLGCHHSGNGGYSPPSDGESGWDNEPGGHLLWSVADLRAALDDGEMELVVVDCRHDVDAYDAGHIETAIWISWKELSEDPHVVLPETSDVEAFLGTERGIETTETIVLYGGPGEELVEALRLFWMLEYYGCVDVHILDGGIQAWTEAGYTLETTAWQNVTIEPADFVAAIEPAILAESAEMIQAVSSGDAALCTVLDARSAGEFNGEVLLPIQDRAGHMPTAGNAFWFDCYDPDSSLIRTPAEVKSLFRAAGAVPGRKIYNASAAGVRSTANYFICRLLGYPAKVYLAGFQEWCEVDTDSTLFVERTGPFLHKSVIDKHSQSTFAGATAALGDMIYFFGGVRFVGNNGSLQISNSAWLFNPVLNPLHEGVDTDCWIREHPIGHPKWGLMAATDIAGDAIYLFGGSGPAGAAFDEILKVDINPETMDITGYRKISVSLPESLYGAGCAYNDADGKIYLFGGAREDGTAADAAYAFTPESQGGPAIDAVASLPAARMWCGGVALNGKLYCFGGEDSSGGLHDEVLEYDPAFDTWIPLAPMLDSRLGVKGAVANGRIYACGGFIDDGALGLAASAMVESYDPADPGAGWRREEPMEVARYWHSMTAVRDRIYIFNGYSGHPHDLEDGITFDNVIEYNPVDIKDRNPLPDTQYAGATAVVNGRIYLFGGYDDGNYSDRVFEYDAAADIWTPKDHLPHGAVVGASAVTIGQSAIVMGGRSKAGISLETWKFDPAQPAGSQWSRLADMPEERYGASAVYYDDGVLDRFPHYGPELAFVIGGQDFWDLCRDTILMYDITSDSWHYAPLMPLPQGKSWAVAAIAGTTIYSIGGMADGARVLNECLALDLEETILEWRNAGQMPTARYGHGCAVIDSRIYSVGGFCTDCQGRTASVAAVEVLDGEKGSWTEIAGLPETRGYSFVAPSPIKAPDRTLFVIGGYSMNPDEPPFSFFVDNVIEYRP